MTSNLFVHAATVPVRSTLQHKNLLRDFIKREIRGRFAGSMGGLIWTILSPLTTIIIYNYIFSTVLKIRIDATTVGTDEFFIFFLSGFLPWIFLSESLNRAVGILLENSNLITKVVFPVELLTVGCVTSSILINGVGFLLFLIYLVFKGYLALNWLLLLLVIPFHILFILGISFFLSALCVFIRDIKEILNIFLMLWFFSTPIVYQTAMAPDLAKRIIQLNPMYLFIEVYRSIIIVGRIDLISFFWGAIAALVSYGIGSWFFIKAKPAFGDVL